MIFLLTSLAWATKPVDPFTEPDETEQFRLERQVVTVASRYAQTVEQAPSIVTLISSNEIERMGHRTLSDALRGIPGIYIAWSKESRQLSWVRGASSADNNKILLLIDGVPWYDGVYTHAWLDEYIPLSNVRQIEVIKGPGSAIYGTNAFSGVINVVTIASDKSDYAKSNLSVGSFGRREISAMAGQRFGEKSKIDIYARHLETRGQGLFVNPKGQYIVTPRNPRQSINGGFRFRWGSTEFRYDVVDFSHEYFVSEQADMWQMMVEGSEATAMRYQNEFAYVKSDFEVGSWAKIKPYAYLQRHDNLSTYGFIGSPEVSLETSKDGEIESAQAQIPRILFQAVKKSDRYGAGIEFNLRPTVGHITVAGVGMDATHIRELQDNLYIEDSGEPVLSDFYAVPNGWISDTFAFAQHTWTATWWMELTAGARIDAHTYSGISVSPRAGILFVPASDLFVKLLYGRAFRTPNARELLVTVEPDENNQVSYTNGNPSLKAESIDTIEFEVSGKPLKDLSLRGAVFGSLIQNEINKNTPNPPDPTLGNIFYDNLGSALALGAETELRYRPRGYRLDLSYSYTDATQTAVSLEGTEISRTAYEFPPHMGHLTAGMAISDSFWIIAQGDFYGPRPRSEWTENSQLTNGDPFAIWRLSISSNKLAKGKVRVHATLFNVLNTAHKYLIYVDDANELNSSGEPKYANDIDGEGRMLHLGVTAQF